MPGMESHGMAMTSAVAGSTIAVVVLSFVALIVGMVAGRMLS